MRGGDRIGLYAAFMRGPKDTRRTFMDVPSRNSLPSSEAAMDLIYIAIGMGLFVTFALYVEFLGRT